MHAVELNRISAMLRSTRLPEYTDTSLFSEVLQFRSPTRTFPCSWLAHLQRLYAHVLLGALPQWSPATSVACDSDGEEEEEDEDAVAEAMSCSAGLRSHLLCHAAEGYWVPLAELSQSGSATGCDFERPLVDETGRLPGGWFGSSYRLHAELLEMCPALGIELRPLRGAGALKALRRGGGLDLSKEALKSLQGSSRAALRALSESVLGAGATAAGEAQGSDPDEVEEAEGEECKHRGGGSGGGGGGCLAPMALERHVWFVLYEAARLSTKHRTAILLQCL